MRVAASLVKLWEIFNCCEENLLGSSCSCGAMPSPEQPALCVFSVFTQRWVTVWNILQQNPNWNVSKDLDPLGYLPVVRADVSLDSTQKLQGSWCLHFPRNFPSLSCCSSSLSRCQLHGWVWSAGQQLPVTRVTWAQPMMLSISYSRPEALLHFSLKCSHFHCIDGQTLLRHKLNEDFHTSKTNWWACFTLLKGVTGYGLAALNPLLLCWPELYTSFKHFPVQN